MMNASKMVSALELNPKALPATHPNTPVMPFTTPTKKASFIDPTVTIRNGNSVVISFQSYVAPYATLDARGGGAIKIGDGSDVLDSASSWRIRVMRTGRRSCWSATTCRSARGRRSWVPARSAPIRIRRRPRRSARGR